MTGIWTWKSGFIGWNQFIFDLIEVDDVKGLIKSGGKADGAGQEQWVQLLLSPVGITPFVPSQRRSTVNRRRCENFPPPFPLFWRCTSMRVVRLTGRWRPMCFHGVSMWSGLEADKTGRRGDDKQEHDILTGPGCVRHTAGLLKDHGPKEKRCCQRNALWPCVCVCVCVCVWYRQSEIIIESCSHNM